MAMYRNREQGQCAGTENKNNVQEQGSKIMCRNREQG